jgi:membrane associated rhomboid family serine protease
MPAIVFAVLYLAYSWYMAKNAKDNIGHDAHFFGAITGLGFTIIFVPGVVPQFFKYFRLAQVGKAR